MVEPDAGSPARQEPAVACLDLWHGHGRKMGFCIEGEPGMPNPIFTLSASRGILMRVMGGELDPVQAMVKRKLKVKGNLAHTMRNAPVVLGLVRCRRAVGIVR